MPRYRATYQNGGYVPEFGHVVHLNWSPQAGSEMMGPHYGLVLSATAFNHATGLCMVVPITSKVGKLGGFEFPVTAGKVNGAAILSGLRSLDFQVREIAFEADAGEDAAKTANKRLSFVLTIG